MEHDEIPPPPEEELVFGWREVPLTRWLIGAVIVIVIAYLVWRSYAQSIT